MLRLEGMERFTHPYLELVEVDLKIPQFPEYGETALMLVISDTKYICDTHEIQGKLRESLGIS